MGENWLLASITASHQVQKTRIMSSKTAFPKECEYCEREHLWRGAS